MSTIAPARPMTVPEALARVPSSLYRMTLKQYETMIAAGSFTKRDRVQLINGYLVTRMTELPPHGATCEMIRLAIEKFFPRVGTPSGDIVVKKDDDKPGGPKDANKREAGAAATAALRKGKARV